MKVKTDKEIIRQFIKKCAAKDLTTAQMGAAVSRTRTWAYLLITDQIHSLKFQTRNRIIRFLEAK